MGTDPRYEDPRYRGPETNGLNEDASFYLAKQLRIAARNKRIAQKLGDARVARGNIFMVWQIVCGLTFIIAGLAVSIWAVQNF